eukprot:scaffold91542_cov48-Attheya_sp.AAC.3
MAKDLYNIGSKKEARNTVDLKFIVETKDSRACNSVADLIKIETALTSAWKKSAKTFSETQIGNAVSCALPSPSKTSRHHHNSARSHVK